MAATEPVNTAVVTSPSFVLVQDAAAFMPKFVLGVIVLAIGTLVFTALMVFLSAILQGLSRRTSAALSDHPWKSLALGLSGFAILGSSAALAISYASVEYLLRTEYDPFLLTLGITICVLTVIMTFAGGTGVVQATGNKLEQLNTGSMSGLRRTFWGSLTLVGACLFPAIGWFIILPASLLLALGAMLEVLLPKRKARR